MKIYLPLFCLLFIIIQSCEKSSSTIEVPTPTMISSRQTAIISNYTSGLISKTEDIIIKFQKPIVGEPKMDNLLSFQPNIIGKLELVNDRTIRFSPEEHLAQDQAYLAKLNLGKLFPDLKDNDQNFEFSFSVIKQYFSVDISQLQWDNAEAGTYKIEGTINTNDFAAAELVEKCIAIRPSNLTATWLHTENNKLHKFFINNIKRSNTESKIEILHNGEPLKIRDLNGSKTIIIPAIGDFKILDVNANNGDSQYLSINFSERIDPQQNLAGLIKIEDYDEKLEFAIENNIVKVYPKGKLSGSKRISVFKGIKNVNGQGIKNESSYDLTFAQLEPGLALIGKGVIVPDSEGMLFPFKAVNLRAVEVEIFKIYDNNLLQYFQENYYNSNNYYSTNRVGRIVMQTALDLKLLNENASQGSWANYALDLRALMELERGALYEVRLGFKRAYAITDCEGSDHTIALNLKPNDIDDNKQYTSWFEDSYYGEDGYYAGYYDEQDNPCKPAFYKQSRFISRKIYSSNIGIIAKTGAEGSLFIACNDLVTTKPIPKIQVDIYDYQMQKMRTLTTQTDGIINTNLKRTPYFIVASRNEEKGVIALNDGWSLSVSNFDVGGAKTQSGLKGEFYAERGVWRPGDDIYLNFVLEDEFDKLPDNHPVNLRFIDPQGKEHARINTIGNVNGVYPFVLSTDQESPTGNWRVDLKVGTASFSKSLKIETVKPNRLKIKFDRDEDMITSSEGNINTDIEVKWLVGTPAKNAKVKVEMQMKTGTTNFNKFKDYTFADPSRNYEGEPIMVFDGAVDEKGKATISKPLKNNENLPGMMKLSFQTKAFEPGGDFSIDNFTIPYSPFPVYTGISLPKGKYGSDRLNIREDNKINIVSVNEKGESVNGRKLSGAIYRLGWRWWWDNSRNRLSQYNTSNYKKAVTTFDVVSRADGASFDFKPKEWGRYLIRICDTESGHCSGKITYAGYPYGSDDGNDYATMLSLSADKEEYKTGEEIKITFPSAAAGRALVSIENGAKVLQTYWVNTEANQTAFSFYAEPNMSPTIYANVTYIQPHANVENDLPIRMYGIVPINVYDANTRLSPEIATADSFQPEEKVSIQISEKDGRAMTYTLAIVDEGLLDLTRFKTPNLWEEFYAREALGVKSWDIYDYVMGSFGGQIEKIVSIGGDEELNPDDKKNKANRFEPVVQHFGPYYLKPGNKKTHEFVMPNYIGSVRVMAVAAHEGAYGSTEVTKPVKKPLMLLTTLPRVLSPTESMQVPVSIFAMENKIKKVKVTIEDKAGIVRFPKGNSQTITFSEIGEKMAYFDMEVTDKIGVSEFNITAESAGQRASQQIEIQIDNPNEFISEVEGDILNAGANWSHTISAIGMPGTNDAVLEVSNVPPLNLDKRLKYLLRYPHGCLEQTVSAAFPLLYLDRFVTLSEEQKKDRKYYIDEAIGKLSSFAKSNGAFAYWPGSYINYWANSYAGNFIIEAQKLGFAVPKSLLSKWLTYQKNSVNQYQLNSENYGNNNLTQAYRLYTLAIAGQPALGAMNRLRQIKTLDQTSNWRLAAAYAAANRPEVAKDILKNINLEINEYKPQLGYNFSSMLRDEGMMLETLSLLNDREGAFKVLTSISKRLTSNRYYNTHGLSFALLGVGKFLSEKKSDDFSFKYSVANKNETNFASNKPFASIQLKPDQQSGQKINIINTSENDLFVRVVSSGKPTISQQKAEQSDLKLTLRYLDGAGKALDISSLEQSADIIVECKIANPGTRGISYENLALTQVLPSGWEVINDRMSAVDTKFKSSAFTNQDIRDDRVHTYFDLNINKSKTFYTRLTATYQGNYYLPNQICKAMYDESIIAVVPGKMVNVVKQ